QIAEQHRHHLPLLDNGRRRLLSQRRATRPAELEALRALLATSRTSRHAASLGQQPKTRRATGSPTSHVHSVRASKSVRPVRGARTRAMRTELLTTRESERDDARSPRAEDQVGTEVLLRVPERAVVTGI